MKIVIFPGVGSDRVKPSHEYFAGKLRDGLRCDTEIFIWENGHDHPQTNLPLKDVRNFVCEVILDFQQVVVHALDMKVPDADVYIGHSAGSILALAQDKPSVIFASPASLVELIHDNNLEAKKFNDIIRRNKSNVLNIINKYDVISYPLDGNNIENYEYSGSWCNPLSYFPVTSHIGYWRSDKVIKKIIKTLKDWKVDV